MGNMGMQEKKLTRDELRAMPLSELKQRVKHWHRKNWDKYPEEDYAFISYSHADDDAKKVYELVAWLLQEGVRISIDTEYAGDSKSWVELMERRLENPRCKVMMAFFSKNYIQSYPALMEFLYRYSTAVRIRRYKKRELPLIPVNLNSDRSVYIKTAVYELAQSSREEALKEEPSNEEIECVKSGLKGLMNLDGTNGDWYSTLEKMVAGSSVKTKQGVALCMSEVIENQEPQFDNSKWIDDWEDILNSLKTHQILVHDHEETIPSEVMTMDSQEVSTPQPAPNPPQDGIRLSCQDFMKYMDENKSVSFPSGIKLEAPGTVLGGLAVQENTIRAFYKSMVQAMAGQLGEEYLRKAYEGMKSNKEPHLVPEERLAAMDWSNQKHYTRMENQPGWYLYTHLSNKGFVEKLRTRLRETGLDVTGVFLKDGGKQAVILAASRTENGGTGGLAENTAAAETAATAQELSMPQETAFRQPIRDFKKTFEVALSDNKKEFMRLTGGGKTPPVGFKRISLELPGPDGAVQVTGNKWKPLFGQMLEAFYWRSGKGFFEACAAEADRGGNAEPYVVSGEMFEARISEANKKHYQPLKAGDFWFRNWYGADLLVNEVMKWMERYNGYLSRNGGPSYDLDQYFVEYEPEAEFIRYFKL